jgi:hypothetical protein
LIPFKIAMNIIMQDAFFPVPARTHTFPGGHGRPSVFIEVLSKPSPLNCGGIFDNQVQGPGGIESTSNMFTWHEDNYLWELILQSPRLHLKQAR